MKIFNSLVVAFFIVFIYYIISHLINDNKKNNESVIEKAIKDGHVVTAVLVKRKFARLNRTGANEFGSSIGFYKYTYKGRTYKYKYYANNLPNTLKLYFVKNPSKATISSDMSTVNHNWFLIFVVVAVLVYLLIFSY